MPMAQTVNGKTVSFIKSRLGGSTTADITALELDHATKVDAEITAVGSNPTTIQTDVDRSPHGAVEILSVLIWV